MSGTVEERPKGASRMATSKSERISTLLSRPLRKTCWDIEPPDGISWTEHKLSFTDVLLMGSNEVYKACGRVPDCIYAGLDIISVIESLPGFRSEALSPAIVKSIHKRGTLNGRWEVYAVPLSVISPNVLAMTDAEEEPENSYIVEMVGDLHTDTSSKHLSLRDFGRKNCRIDSLEDIMDFCSRAIHEFFVRTRGDESTGRLNLSISRTTGNHTLSCTRKFEFNPSESPPVRVVGSKLEDKFL